MPVPGRRASARQYGRRGDPSRSRRRACGRGRHPQGRTGRGRRRVRPPGCAVAPSRVDRLPEARPRPVQHGIGRWPPPHDGTAEPREHDGAVLGGQLDRPVTAARCAATAAAQASRPGWEARARASSVSVRRAHTATVGYARTSRTASGWLRSSAASSVHPAAAMPASGWADASAASLTARSSVMQRPRWAPRNSRTACSPPPPRARPSSVASAGISRANPSTGRDRSP